MDELTTRLNHLEQQVRRLRQIVNALSVLLIVTLVSCSTIGNAKKKKEAMRLGNVEVLTVRKLVVADERGNPRVIAGTFKDGSAGVSVYDRDGKRRIHAAALQDRNAGIYHYDRKGLQRVSTLTLNDGAGGMNLRDRDGKTRVTMSTRGNGNAGIDHFDRQGKMRITVGTVPNDQANILHYDQAGIKRVMALTTSGGAVAIGVTDRTGNATWVEGSE
jgi:hypothetical protein